MASSRTISRFDVRDYDHKYGTYCNSKDKMKHWEFVAKVILKWDICNECGVQYYE